MLFVYVALLGMVIIFAAQMPGALLKMKEKISAEEKENVIYLDVPWILLVCSPLGLLLIAFKEMPAFNPSGLEHVLMNLALLINTVNLMISIGSVVLFNIKRFRKFKNTK